MRNKHTIATQNVFRHVIRRVEEKGMRVNAGKTNMVCISDALNFRVGCFIEDREGTRVESADKMKVLGWYFSSRTTPADYIDMMKRRFRERYWTLRHLKHNGFDNTDLVRVYTAVIRPVADYMICLLYTSPSPRDRQKSRMPSSA